MNIYVKYVDPLDFVLKKFCIEGELKILERLCVMKGSVLVLCIVGVPTLKLIEAARTKVSLLAGIAG